MNSALGPITDPYYRFLLELLHGRSSPPLSLVLFRDGFLPLYAHLHKDEGGATYLITLVQFLQWYQTYRGYFFALPETLQLRAPPPLSTSPTHSTNTQGTPYQKESHLLPPPPSMAPPPPTSATIGGGSSGDVESPLPYRTEVDCALAHYLASGGFSNAARLKVTTAARDTTHPDLFLPIVHEAHAALLPAARLFLMYAAHNMSPLSRKLRLGVCLLALVAGAVILAGCFVWSAARWWRIVPLPWMTLALFYFIGAVGRVDALRAGFGVTEKGLLEAWLWNDVSPRLLSKDQLQQAKKRKYRAIIVEDDWVKAEQRRRIKRMLAVFLPLTVVLWVVVLVV